LLVPIGIAILNFTGLKAAKITLLSRELAMTKSELIRTLNEKLPDHQLDDVELAVNCLLKHMSDGLVKGERIEIRGFGSFNLHHRPPRTARNPRTGEAVELPAKVVVHFKPGKDLKDRINASRDQCEIEE
jgi:integration host factor subunit beta